MASSNASSTTAKADCYHLRSVIHREPLIGSQDFELNKGSQSSVSSGSSQPFPLSLECSGSPGELPKESSTVKHKSKRDWKLLDLPTDILDHIWRYAAPPRYYRMRWCQLYRTCYDPLYVPHVLHYACMESRRYMKRNYTPVAIRSNFGTRRCQDCGAITQLGAGSVMWIDFKVDFFLDCPTELGWAYPFCSNGVESNFTEAVEMIQTMVRNVAAVYCNKTFWLNKHLTFWHLVERIQKFPNLRRFVVVITEDWGAQRLVTLPVLHDKSVVHWQETASSTWDHVHDLRAATGIRSLQAITLVEDITTPEFVRGIFSLQKRLKTVEAGREHLIDAGRQRILNEQLPPKQLELHQSWETFNPTNDRYLEPSTTNTLWPVVCETAEDVLHKRPHPSRWELSDWILTPKDCAPTIHLELPCTGDAAHLAQRLAPPDTRIWGPPQIFANLNILVRSRTYFPQVNMTSLVPENYLWYWRGLNYFNSDIVDKEGGWDTPALSIDDKNFLMKQFVIWTEYLRLHGLYP